MFFNSTKVIIVIDLGIIYLSRIMNFRFCILYIIKYFFIFKSFFEIISLIL